MHRNLYRISVHQRLNTFGLVSVGKLVCCVYINFDLSAGCFFHKFTELTSAFCPCTCLRCGACKVPCCFRPVKITVVIHSIHGIFCEKIYQILCIIIALTLQFLNKPIVYTINSFFEGINIHIFFLCESYAIAFFPAAHDLFVTGTVDVTLILYCFLSTLINNCLLLCGQTVIDILIDTEEQTVINCIPHRAVWLNFLYTCCINCRQRVFLAFYCVLLQCGVGFGPVHVGRICAPSLIAFHKKV